jgi:hypothetical protein
MCSHVPNKGEQMVRYYGYYSNVSIGKRQKTGDDAAMAYILDPPLPDKTFRKNWARLIQKIYEVDPLVCPACRGEMRVIAFIEDQEVIRKILTHLGLWQIKARPRPVAHAPPGSGRCTLRRLAGAQRRGLSDQSAVSRRSVNFERPFGSMWWGLSENRRKRG